jgi:hypothetical protein
MDGNWFGDPAHADAWRWYPPLFHMLAAAAFRLSDVALLPGWVHVGPWLNLTVPLFFYRMNTRLIGYWPAVAATAVLTVLDPLVMRSDEVASYTPETLTPALGWAVFYFGVWLMMGCAQNLRWRGAFMCGAYFGLALLGHLVPALLLSAIAVTVVLASHGLHLRTIGWLAIVASLQLAIGALFIAPLLAVYRLHIANPMPNAWIHELLQPQSVGRLILLSLPGVLALPMLARLERPAITAIATWIAVCLLFLLRHYLCVAGLGGAGCAVLPIPAHHFHTYLQGAWATLIGVALWQAGQCLPRPIRLRLAAALVMLAWFATFVADGDGMARDAALQRPDAVLDRTAYRWILQHSSPGDLFAMPLPAEPDWMGATVATAIATGRRLVAAPAVHSNPYLDWPSMNARRLDYLSGTPASVCRFAAEAGRGAAAWFLLPVDAPPPAAPLMFRTTQHALYRVDDSQCYALHQLDIAKE